MFEYSAEQEAEITRMTALRAFGLTKLAERDIYCWATASAVDDRQTQRLIEETLSTRDEANAHPTLGTALRTPIDFGSSGHTDPAEEERLDAFYHTVAAVEAPTASKRMAVEILELVATGSVPNGDGRTSQDNEAGDEHRFTAVREMVPGIREAMRADYTSIAADDLERGRKASGHVVRWLLAQRLILQKVEAMREPVQGGSSLDQFLRVLSGDAFVPIVGTIPLFALWYAQQSRAKSPITTLFDAWIPPWERMMTAQIAIP